MTDARDELAALIWRWMSDNNDDYVENPDDPYVDVTAVRIDATLNLVKLADAILARWELTQYKACGHPDRYDLRGEDDECIACGIEQD